MSMSAQPLQNRASGSVTQPDAAPDGPANAAHDDDARSIPADAACHARFACDAVPSADGGGASLAVLEQADHGAYLDALRVLFGNPLRPEQFDSERWSEPMLSHLCADALQANIAVKRVTQLIRQRDLHPENLEVLHWPWPMRVYTLGRFSLVRDGQAVTFRGKSPRKPLELLQVLIALGGREVHTSQLMRVLWPGSDGRDLRKLFDNTLHRLRQIVGHDAFVVLRDAKLTLDVRHCWVDAWAFDSIAGRLCEGEAVSPQMANEARRLYQGHFLQRDAQEAWLLPYAERMRSRFHRFILVQGECLELAGQWETACQIYDHAIEIDCLAEIMYRRLMVCLLHRGEVAQAVCVYRRCCDLLSIVLGVKPSHETEAIRHQLENR